MIVLRPPSFAERDVHFVIHLAQPSSAEPQPLACKRVPPHLRSRPWTALVGHAEVTDVLVSLDEPVLRVLAKFESPRFVHTFSRTTSGGGVDAGAGGAARATHIELPRFGLEFEVRGDALVSRDYAGYALAPRQQLPHTLQPFTQCLVLQQLPGVRLAVGLTSAEQLLLVPAGPVARNTSGGGPAGAVRVVVSDECGEEIKVRAGAGAATCNSILCAAISPTADVCVCCASSSVPQAHRYEVHGRFSHLRTSGVEARLQLAALYAASGTLLPDPATHLTGGQQALQLLRQCWVNRPLSEREAQHLHSAARLGGHLTPALHLVAHELALGAWHVHHLHGNVAAPAPWLEADAATSYVQQQRAARVTDHPQSVRLRDALTPEEERRVLGTCGAAPDVPAWAREGLFTPVAALPACPVAADAVAAAEERLTRLLRFRPPHAGGPAPSYPLQQAAGSTPLERDMHLELQQSWDAHHNLHRAQVSLGAKLIQQLVQEQVCARACRSCDARGSFRVTSINPHAMLAILSTGACAWPAPGRGAVPHHSPGRRAAVRGLPRRRLPAAACGRPGAHGRPAGPGALVVAAPAAARLQPVPVRQGAPPAAAGRQPVAAAVRPGGPAGAHHHARAGRQRVDAAAGAGAACKLTTKR